MDSYKNFLRLLDESYRALIRRSYSLGGPRGALGGPADVLGDLLGRRIKVNATGPFRGASRSISFGLLLEPLGVLGNPSGALGGP